MNFRTCDIRSASLQMQLYTEREHGQNNLVKRFVYKSHKGGSV